MLSLLVLAAAAASPAIAAPAPAYGSNGYDYNKCVPQPPTPTPTNSAVPSATASASPSASPSASASPSPSPSAAAVNYLLIGDWGSQGSDQQNVGLVMQNVSSQLNPAPAFVVNTGDNFYPGTEGYEGVQNSTDVKFQVRQIP
eukprot:jgi/Hompol1/1239/HPOL_004879-RA